jgi:hypothetical protein
LCKSSNGKTPYELWTGSTPAVHHLRTFGCVAHVKITTPNLKTPADRSKKMIFVGYEPGSAAYRCYDPATNRVHVSRDVIFDEEGEWDWSGDQANGMVFDFLEQDVDYFQTIESRTEHSAVPDRSGAADEDNGAMQDEGFVDSPSLAYRTLAAGGVSAAIGGSASTKNTTLR